MPRRKTPTAGTISELEAIAEELSDRIVEETEALIADAIDKPFGGEEAKLADRLLHYQAILSDPMEAEALWDEQTEAEGLNPFDPNNPDSWQVPKTVLTYLRARARELKTAEEREAD